jgi:hypothetical protein
VDRWIGGSVRVVRSVVRRVLIAFRVAGRSHFSVCHEIKFLFRIKESRDSRVIVCDV